MKKIKLLGITGIGLCALCCMLPLLGGILGAGAIASLGAKMELLGIIFIGLSAFAFVVYYLKKMKKAKACACATDCNCKTEKSSSKA